MTIKYAVLNPSTGTYSYSINIEDRNKELAKVASEFYFKYAQNDPFSIVEIDENGNEIWKTATGDDRLTPDQIEADILKLNEEMLNSELISKEELIRLGFIAE